MTRWIIFSALVIGVATAATIAVQYMPDGAADPIPAARAVVETGPPPKLVVTEPAVFEFGTMSEQVERTKIWNVRNEGQGPLRLTLIEKSCTCTDVRFGEDGKKLDTDVETTIPPGETRELYFTWKPKAGSSQEAESNAFSSNVRFATNDFEGQPTIAFGVEGKVVASVVVLPQALAVDEVANDEAKTFSIAVFSPSMPELKFTEPPATSRPDFLVTEVKPMTPQMLADLAAANMKTETGYQVTIEIKPGMPLGRFADNLVIKTDHPAVPRIDIPISGKIIGPISALPAGVFLPGVSSKMGAEQVLTLTVRGHDSTRFEVQTPPELDGIVRAAVEPASENADGNLRQYKLVVKVPPGARSGKFSGSITLKTDHPAAAEVKIPVQAFIQAG